MSKKENKKKGTVVVVLSGGQDSVTCLGQALALYENVQAIGFRYGQKHLIEMKQAKIVCDIFNVPFVIHDIPSLAALGDSALTTDGDVTEKHHRLTELPASFVPNRNTLFLTIAHAFAQKIGAEALITGVCQTDYSGYPDCREEFIQSLEATLNLGYCTDIAIFTPLMHLTKAETFALAAQYDFLDVVISNSHTCYNGDRTIEHDWGFGCGECAACELRAKGYHEYVEDFTNVND